MYSKCYIPIVSVCLHHPRLTHGTQQVNQKRLLNKVQSLQNVRAKAHPHLASCLQAAS